MDYRDLTAEDEELIAAAFEAIRRGYRQDRHGVGAAVRTGSGKVYTGVCMESPGVDMCAEWVAMGSAATAGERTFTCVVALEPSGADRGTPSVMSPCGVCRELLHFYGPEMDVIVPAKPGPRKVKISELLPIPYKQNRSP
jgi:cytidine deaminase